MKRMICFVLILVSLTGCGRQAETVHTSAPVQTTSAPAQTVVETPASTVETPAATLETTVPTTAPEPEDGDFVRVTVWLPTVREELAYATEHNFTGQRIYDFTEGFLRYGTVKKLALVCEELETRGLGLILWDGFRPLTAQGKLWEACPDPNYVSPPGTGTRSHCRGNTVDISLYDLQTGEEIPMPTGFDDFSLLADRDYSDCAPEAAENARLLESIMEKHGFKPYFKEWWHFSDTVDYPIEETFSP